MPSECAAVVKGDAYGCGIDQVTTALTRAGCQTFFVAHLAEARRVRAIAPEAAIYVLNGFSSAAGAGFVETYARPVINSLVELAEWDHFVVVDRLHRQRGAACRHRHEPARPHHRGGGGDRRAHPLRKPSASRC